MRDLIFVSMENWDDIWRRNQFLCAGFLRRFPDLRILFVGLPRDVSHAVRSGHLAAVRAPQLLHPPGYPAITLCRPAKYLPTSLALGRRCNDWVFRRTVAAAARTIGMERPVLWLNPHYAVHMVGRIPAARIIYDITDDWIELTQSAFIKQLTIAQDAQLCRRVDSVIVCSQKLYELKQPLARDLHMIPNGVDAAHYHSVAQPYAQNGSASAAIPAAARAWPKPVLGYTGTIHPDRLDVDLVEKMARGLTAGSIVLIGPNLLSPADIKRLKATGKVFLHPAVPYREIPNFMRAFDICITPHRVTPFTESLNPIKLWEYLAAGKPIISTPVAGFRDYPQHVYLAADAPSFLAAVPVALREPAPKIAARLEAAAHHSWDARIAQIVPLLEPDTVTLAARQVVLA